MDSQENVTAHRFRIVPEASFPTADPVDPTEYDDLFAGWKRTLETDPVRRASVTQMPTFFSL
jgi:hypothetical protein